MNRREARICAFELLFETDFQKDEDTWSEIYARAIRDREMHDHPFVKELYSTAMTHKEEIDERIVSAAENWRLSRMSAVTRAVLRLCVTELLYTQTPPKVAINEAIEISKLYNDSRSTAFVNGILNKIAKAQGALAETGDNE